MEEFDRWLGLRVGELLKQNGVEDDDDVYGVEAFMKAIKAKVLESYRNGQRSRRPKKDAPSSAKQRRSSRPEAPSASAAGASPAFDEARSHPQ